MEQCSEKSRFKSSERCVTAARVTLRTLTHDVAARTWRRYFKRKEKQKKIDLSEVLITKG